MISRSRRKTPIFGHTIARSEAGEIGVEGSLLEVHRGLREVIGDAAMNALSGQEVKFRLANSAVIKGFSWSGICQTVSLLDFQRLKTTLKANARAPIP